MVIKTVAGDGTGDYNCDGVNDEVQINQALIWAQANPQNTIHIKGPFTYDIQDSLLVGSYTTIKMDPGTKLKLHAAAGWSVDKPIIGQLETPLANVEIYGGEIDVNFDNQSVALNSGYYPCIVFSNVTNVNVHDINMHDGAGHGLHVTTGENIIFHSNTVKNLGGDACFCDASKTVDIYSNNITVRGNSAVHIKNTATSLTHHNYITGIDDETGGIAGILIEDTDGTTTYPLIYENAILDTYGPGILIQETGTGYKNKHKHCHCHHNMVRGAGTTQIYDFNSGCTVQGFNGAKIEYNLFDNCYNAGVLVRYPPLSDGDTLELNKNTITNTKRHRNNQYHYNWSGRGIANNASQKTAIYLYQNVCYNNEGGDYFGVNGSGDIQTSIPITAYIPPTSYIQDEVPDYYITNEWGKPHTAYINRYPFRWQTKKITVKKTIGQENPPGVDGWALEDFGFGGAEITLDCYAYSLQEMQNVISAFYSPGKSILELGGLYAGWRITGVTVHHSTDLQLRTIIPEKAYPYSIFFISDKPIMESNTKKIRTKKVTDDQQTWASDDCYPGNLIKNWGFHTWTKKVASMSWESRASAVDNNFTGCCYGTSKFVAVSNSGTDNRVMVSIDGGDTYTCPTLTNANRNNNWTDVCFGNNLFVAVSNSGTGNRVMTATDPLGTWTSRTSAADSDWRAVNYGGASGQRRYVAVAAGGSNRVMYSSDGPTWNTATAALAQSWVDVVWDSGHGVWVAVSYTGTTQQIMTSSTGSGTWTARNTPLSQAWTAIDYSPSLNMCACCSENGTNMQVMISTSPTTAWTAVYTPETHPWQDINWNDDDKCWVCVASDGAIMTSTDGYKWIMQDSVNSNALICLCYASDIKKYAAFANTGTGNRVIVCDDYTVSNLYNCAPDDWDYHGRGGHQSDYYWSGINSYRIRSDGRTGRHGYISQRFRPEHGSQYTFSATARISGLQNGGRLHAGIYHNDALLKSLDWDSDTEDWDTKYDYYTFDEDELDAELRLYGEDIIDVDAEVYCDRVFLVRSKHFDSSELGNDIITAGTVDVIPDIMITATRLTSGTTTEGFNISQIDGSLTDAEGNEYVLLKAVTLPAKAHKRHRIDKVGGRHCSDSHDYPGYYKVTIQNASLFGGVETLISEFTSDYEYPNFKESWYSPYYTCGENESCTLRYYGRSSHSSHRSRHKDLTYHETEIITNSLGTGIQIYNTEDPLTVMHVCNKLSPGSTMEINHDGTGSFRYLENLVDITYQTACFSRTSDSYNNNSKLLTLASNGSVIYRFDTRYPVTGIPYIVLDVISGSPQIAIASEDSGNPGTYYAIDQNTATDQSGQTIYRELNQAANFQLKGSTVFYVKIYPYTSQSIVINSLFVYADIVTIDAERPKIIANGRPNTFKVNMPNNTALEVSLQYRDAHRLI